MSILLWPAVQQRLEQAQQADKPLFIALHEAIDEVLSKECQTISIPKRLTAMMRAVWMLQYHLIRRRGKRVYRTLSHRYFRAAYDFLELRAKAGEDLVELSDWWRRFQSESPEIRTQMTEALQQERKR